MKTLGQKMKGIGCARRKKIEARAASMIAEEMTLQELRQDSTEERQCDGR
jgi:hypothetical protein